MLTRAQAEKVDAFKGICPEFAAIRASAVRFRGIRRGGDVEELIVWRHDAGRSALYGIRRFVHTPRLDLATVRDSIRETWSHGQTEGQINRLKRAMYGRAGVILLRARMIPLSLADIVAATGQPCMHFAAQFRAATGLRRHEYLLHRRIERAQTPLLASHLALAVGFKTQAHVTTVFSRLVGQTPNDLARAPGGNATEALRTSES